MPRPRFAKLSLEKRTAILETAAREFAAHGYDGASINRILEQADLSKGAAYYYFDDKADLFLAVLETYVDEMLGIDDFQLEGLTVTTYWSALRAVYSRPFVTAVEKPWLVNLTKALRDAMKNASIAERVYSHFSGLLNWLDEVLKRGQALGLVRTDLPDSLLISLVVNIDSAVDEWILDHWDEMTSQERAALLDKIIVMLERTLAPIE
jgi:AcrR family transcriptional regulator